MKTLEVLKKARDRIANQDHLPKGMFRDFSGCYCLMGAIGIYHNENDCYWMYDYEDDMYAELLGFAYAEHAFNFNDNSTKEEVVAKFDEAIKKLETQ